MRARARRDGWRRWERQGVEWHGVRKRAKSSLPLSSSAVDVDDVVANDDDEEEAEEEEDDEEEKEEDIDAKARDAIGAAVAACSGCMRAYEVRRKVRTVRGAGWWRRVRKKAIAAWRPRAEARRRLRRRRGFGSGERGEGGGAGMVKKDARGAAARMWRVGRSG